MPDDNDKEESVIELAKKVGSKEAARVITEQKAKLKLRVHPNLGKTTPENVRKQIGLSQLGKPRGPQTKEHSEKIAEAIVITEVVRNIDKLNKIASFEKQAQEAGYSQAEIDKFIVEKFLC